MKRKRKRKAQGIKFPTLQALMADPVLNSATMNFLTAFVDFQQALQDRTSFTPASAEDRKRPDCRQDCSADPRRKAARRPRHDESDEDEEEAE